MGQSAVYERASKGAEPTDEESKQDYWLLCASCFWSETAYVGAYGVEWPADVVIQDTRAYHRRCGGRLRVFAA